MGCIPVVDVLGGQVVHARKGDRARYGPISSSLVSGSEPVAVARALLRAAVGFGGAPRLYVADLEALQHGAPQIDLLAGLRRALPRVELWVDAGFADVAAARAWRRAVEAAAGGVAVAGALRTVYASESLADAAALDDVAGEPGAVLSLDRRGDVRWDRAGCWQRPDAWPTTVIVMTLERVGAALGPDLATGPALMAQARAAGRARAPAWVGAGSLRDATDLAAARAAGAAGWLVASALHDGWLRPPAPTPPQG